jgi:hypothetical protein
MLSQLEDVALSKLQRISECTQVLELILTQERKESITILDDKLSNLKGFQRQELYESNIQYIQILSDTIPNMLRSNFFITLYSHLEQILVELCNQLQKSFNFRVALKDLNGRGCARCRKYLIKVVGINFPKNEWVKIKFYMDLRNHLVHNGMYIFDKEDKEEKKIKEKILKTPSLQIDQYDTIQFSHEFVTDVLNDISSFLSDIFHNIHQVFKSKAEI